MRDDKTDTSASAKTSVSEQHVGEYRGRNLDVHRRHKSFKTPWSASDYSMTWLDPLTPQDLSN